MASAKKDFPPWRDYWRWRRYGGRSRDDFSPAQRAASAAAAIGVRLYSRMVTATCSVRVNGDEPFRMEVIRGRPNVIWLMWHNRMPGFVTYCDWMARRNSLLPVASIVSPSKDGELLARPLREIGALEIRGSSSSQGDKALRAAVEAARAGVSIATVGDGPRGPRYQLKAGPILLAKATGMPIVLCTWTATRAAQLHRSWDQMMFPLPFARVEMQFAPPFHVPRDANAPVIAEIRRELEQRLMLMTGQADAQTRIALQIPKPKAGEVLKRRKAEAVPERRL